MKGSDIAAEDGIARLHFSYLADPVGHDTWRSHADEALARKPWSGDCDDLASTVLDLLGRAGMPLADRYMLEVSTSGDSVPDHLVAGCADEAGRFWVVGDTTAEGVYRAELMTHRAIKYHRLSEMGPPLEWRSGAPWAEGVAA